MWRRLGQSGYRAESPQHAYVDSICHSRQSDFSLPSTDYLDAISMISLTFEEDDICSEHQQVPRDHSSFKQEQLVDRLDLSNLISNICKKLDKIVQLVSDFTTDAVTLRENAQDLLDELHTRVLPYLMKLDVEMKTTECIIRHNIDRTNINCPRLSWLLEYNKYYNELRRVFAELSETVYSDLEESLQLRFRGVISFRPSAESVENLAAMRSGMKRAKQLICDRNPFAQV